MNTKNKSVGMLAKPLLVLAAAGLMSSAALALPEVGTQEGWSGEVAFGAGYFDIKSNTISGNDIVDLSNDRLKPSDLTGNKQASSRDTFFPVVNGEVRWTLGRRNQLFLGSSVEDAVTLDSGVQLGWRKGTDNAGTFQVGALLNKAIPLEVYEDPYKTGSKRKKTDSDRTGLRFQWDKIFGTEFEWQLTARNIDVDKDRAGESLVPGVLTTSERRLLRRDADEVSTRVSYLFDLGGGHNIRPLIGYADYDADGDAATYDVVRAQVTYAYRGDKTDFVSNIIWGDRDYDKDDPVYGADRDGNTLAVDATLFYTTPWGGDNRWRLFVNALWGQFDSDVNFYDIDAASLSAGVQYKFGDQ